MTAARECAIERGLNAARDKAFRVAIHVLRNREEAEDVVSISVRRAWARREDLQPETVEGYLCRVAQRAALDAIRNKRRRVQTLPLDPPSDLLDDGVDGADAVHGYDHFPTVAEWNREYRLAQALAVVRPNELEMLQLSAEDVPHTEIARRLGLHTNSVKKRLFNIRGRISGVLG